jgi:predicted  nucleic acid-binding Zn-ribbon protein
VRQQLLRLQSIDLDLARLRKELGIIRPDRATLELREGMRRRIQELETQREQVAARLPGADLSAYELRRNVLKGPWVTQLVKQACSSCQARLPTKMVFEILTQGVCRPCFGCSRLLVSAD